MSTHLRIAAAACGFACVLTACLPGCGPPPDEPRPLGSRPARSADDEPSAAAKPGPVLIPPGLDEEALAAGHVALFDGQTLFGWLGVPGSAVVRDGLLVLGPGVPRDREIQDRDVLYVSMPLPIGPTASAVVRGGPSRILDSIGGSRFPPDAGPFPIPALGAATTASVKPINVDPEEDPDLDAVRQVTGLGFGGNDEHYSRLTYRPRVPPLDAGAFATVPGSACEVKREKDELRLTGGPGYLVSEETYGDFVLQCEVKCHAADSNSGLFFRAMEPTADAPANGYECQIQNTLGPGGRTDPDDYQGGFGTGAIFRRQPARYVNADDGEWFHLTLVCVGNRMATWVNGLQVTDFSDDREPDKNPRKGRRDEPGYLLLQAHDAATDVSFRNFRIQSLNAE